MRLTRIAGTLGGAALAAAALVSPAVAKASPAPVATASPACNSANGFLNNTTYNLVDHWYQAGNVLTTPVSGHQSFCLHTYGSGPTYQLVFQGGAATGDCVKMIQQDNYVAAGCARENDEVFAFITVNGGPTELKNIQYGLCMYWFSAGAYLSGADCVLSGAHAYTIWKLG